jgi:hypothetical protein
MTQRMVGAIGAALCLVALACPPAGAQSATPEQARSAAYRRVAYVCAPEMQRFCSPIDQSPALLHAQAKCLKLHRADLSLPCRHAVNAATAPAEPAP